MTQFSSGLAKITKEISGYYEALFRTSDVAFFFDAS